MSIDSGAVQAVKLAIFAATSGHSGVDRILANLVPAMIGRGVRVDVLGIQGHGPELPALPAGGRHLRFPVRHVATALPYLVRYLRRERPRVLLADKDRVNRTAWLARRLAGGDTRLALRLGTTVSQNLASRSWLDRVVQTGSMRLLYRHADHVLVPSLGAADDLAAYAGLARDAIRVVANPVVRPDMAALAAEPVAHPWFAAGAPPVLLGVGELSTRKDFATLVRAHARLVERLDCRLVILGEGRQRDALMRLAGQLGTADRLDLPGFVANPYPYMARAAAFALTSRWEGLGIVLVEALALGTPAAACDCPSGPREVLADGRYGPLVAVADDAALADALEGLLRRPPEREALKAAARPYTVAASAEAYLAALELTP
ncbi:glycosyltransferase [Parasulfuritortus cantonensis]|uniref:Glycosyltransferase n=1 Tax=Parasulfuritortus cantonensis TaxID=2528202 RepID=A0A4R1BEC8_9PROT|nr:glycosyltransferase [Parasulfuritortus cantonensis]